MTSRIDASLWLGDDEPPAAIAIPTGPNRAIVMLDDLALHGSVDTMRATFTAALAALDGLQP